ncbi:Hypothetical protein, predicted lipoprotein [Metamycoplasma auris 15026]|uniref:Variable surface lipoprotein n=1 Tax=Metamycoplasma auris 15026 TaxID=1188233 RepID=N9TSM5_9BACT|nr:variable surface lipoprotein [Metamycoplasma auris]ENY69085.1 Hypothetical protein, predicted lipoprotein [Metamycoplasma auris 15026]
MKKFNKSLLVLSSLTPLFAMPLIAAKCSKKIKTTDEETKISDSKTANKSINSAKKEQESNSLKSNQSSTPKKEETALEKLKKQLSELIQDFENMISKIGAAQFDDQKAKKFINDGKHPEYKDKLTKDNFPKLVSEFKSELAEFVKSFKETQKDLTDEVPLEDIKSLIDHNDGINKIMNDKFETFKEFSNLN